MCEYFVDDLGARSVIFLFIVQNELSINTVSQVLVTYGYLVKKVKSVPLVRVQINQ